MKLIKHTLISRLLLVVLNVVLLEACLRLTGYLYLLRTTAPKSVTASNYTIMTIGESTTAYGGDNSYSSQLETIVNARGKAKGIRFRVVNKGVPGNTTTRIISNVNQNISEVKPNIIIAMMGINDEHRTNTTGESFIPTVDEKSQFDWITKFMNLRIVKLFRYLLVNLRQYIELSYDITLEKNAVVLNDKLDYYYNNYPDAESEKIVKRILSLEPQDPNIYTNIATYYSDDRKYTDVIKIITAGLERFPKNEQLLLLYAQTLYNIGRGTEAQQYYQKILRINPSSNEALTGLGILLYRLGNYDEAVKTLNESLEKNDKNTDAYVWLGLISKKNQNYSEAESYFQRALMTEPFYPHALREYVNLLTDQHRDLEATKLIHKLSNSLTKFYFADSVARNYRSLIRIAQINNIQVIAMQYPLRSVYKLLSVLSPNVMGIQSTPFFQIKLDNYNITIIDNENTFKNALTKYTYSDLFVDRFAYDFGHATALGNRLIANNLADAIFSYIIH